MKNQNPINTDPAIIRIRAYIREKCPSNLAFAKLANVNEATIRGLFKDKPDPRVTTLRKMEAVIPIDYQPKAG